jgi:uncharacterized YccA/Bax inhibitor family protein
LAGLSAQGADPTSREAYDGCRQRSTSFMEWYSACGLLATVVRLSLEVLCLLARLCR